MAEAAEAGGGIKELDLIFVAFQQTFASGTALPISAAVAVAHLRQARYVARDRRRHIEMAHQREGDFDQLWDVPPAGGKTQSPP